MSYNRQIFENKHLLTAEQMNAIDIGLADAYVELDKKQPKGDYATESYVNEAIASIPTPNISGQINEHNISENAHMDIREAIPTNLSQLQSDDSHQLISAEDKQRWDAKSSFSGNYNDLTNKPEIPSVAGLATEAYVDEQVENAKQVLIVIDPSTGKASMTSSEILTAIGNGNTVILILEIESNLAFLSIYGWDNRGIWFSLEGWSSEGFGNLVACIDDGGNIYTEQAAIPTLNNLTTAINNHNTDTDAHNDIRLLIEGLTTNKVNASDIVNNLTTNVSNKPLSAAQGVALKGLIDGLDTDKLDSSALSSAINTALAQAKTSGEFDGADGQKGDTGQRGTGLLPVTTAPSSYTTAVGGITPKYRMALSTIKTQSGATEVLLGDTIRYSYYHYPIAYMDASYAYFTTRVSIRGATGAAPVKGTDYFTETEKAEIVDQVKAAMPTLTVTGIDENGVSHTWLMYGVSQE